MAAYTDIVGRSQLTGAARVFYASMLRGEQQSKSIIHQFVRDTTDPSANKTHTVTYTRIYDINTNVDTLAELDPTLPHSWLDSDQFSITTQEYGHSLRYTRLLELENYWDTSIQSIVRNQIGKHYVNSADRQALNEYLTCEADFTLYRHYGPPGSSATTRASLVTTDIANTDMVEVAMLALQARDVGEQFSDPGGGLYMLCHPFVLADITRGDDDYGTASLYAGAERQFRGFRAPLWNGVIPIVSTKMVLQNAGDSTEGVQTTLNGAVAGMTSGPIKEIIVTSAAGFAVGDIITIHPVADGTEVLNTSATMENAKIASIHSTTHFVLERPLNHDHANGAYVTKTWNIYPVIFLGSDFEGGETVVRGITDAVTVYSFSGPSLADPVGRYTAVAWYGIYGYDLISPWNMELYMVRSAQTPAIRRQL